MDRVQAPQERHAVKGAVDPVLREVRKQEHGEKLHGEREGCDEGELSCGKHRVAQDPRGKQRRPAERLDEKMADQEVRAVRGPLRPEYLLLAPARDKDCSDFPTKLP